MELRSLALGAAAAVVVFGRFELGMDLLPEPELPGALETLRLEHEGRTRSVQLYVPAHAAKRPALVLVFHGSLGDAIQARTFFGYGFDLLAEEHGFWVAYPEGFERHWNGCRARGPYEANLQNVDDVGFALKIVDAVAARGDLDRSRVFATGVSNGGQMALRLALEAPEHFRAVAPVIAGQPAPSNMGCEPVGKPISIEFLNGTEDPMNPYGGGSAAFYGLFMNRGEVLSTPESVDYWRSLAGAEGSGEQRWLPDTDPDDGTRIEEVTWRAPRGILVRLLAVHGGGHTVPHPEQSMPRMLGHTSHDDRASDLVWRFFAEVAPRPTNHR